MEENASRYSFWKEIGTLKGKIEKRHETVISQLSLFAAHKCDEICDTCNTHILCPQWCPLIAPVCRGDMFRNMMWGCSTGTRIDN